MEIVIMIIGLGIIIINRIGNYNYHRIGNYNKSSDWKLCSTRKTIQNDTQKHNTLHWDRNSFSAIK